MRTKVTAPITVETNDFKVIFRCWSRERAEKYARDAIVSGCHPELYINDTSKDQRTQTPRQQSGTVMCEVKWEVNHDRCPKIVCLHAGHGKYGRIGSIYRNDVSPGASMISTQDLAQIRAIVWPED